MRYTEERKRLFLDLVYNNRGFFNRLLRKGRGTPNLEACRRLTKAGFTAEQIVELRNILSDVVQRTAQLGGEEIVRDDYNFTKWCHGIDFTPEEEICFNKAVIYNFMNGPKV